MLMTTTNKMMPKPTTTRRHPNKANRALRLAIFRAYMDANGTGKWHGRSGDLVPWTKLLDHERAAMVAVR